MRAQGAFWNHYTIYNTRRNERAKRSEKRQRTKRITVRLLPVEHELLTTLAQYLHISAAEMVRWSALDYIKAFEHQLITRRNESVPATEEELSTLANFINSYIREMQP